MKSINILVWLMAAITVSNNLQAQLAVNQKISDQLKNGTVPGWQYNNSLPAKAPEVIITNNQQGKESLITQIRKGTAAGMKFKPGSGAAPTTAPAGQRAAAVKPGTLPSEQPTKAQQPKTITPLAIPSQEEVKKVNTPAVKQ